MADINELYKLLEEKENDLQLAAELGKALLDKNESMVVEYDHTISEHATQIERLKRENAWLKTQVTSQSSELNEAMKTHEEDLQTLREQLKARAKEFSNTTNTMHEMTQLAEQNQRLSAELDKVMENEQKMKEKVQAIRTELSDLSTNHKHLNKEYDRLVTSEKTMLRKWRDAENQLCRLTKTNERLQSQCDELTYNNERLTEEKTELMEQIRISEKQAEHLKEKNQELIEQIQDLANKSTLSSPSFLDELEETQKSLTSGYSSNLSLLELDDDEAIHMLPIDNFSQLKMETSEVYNELQSIIEELETSECASKPPKARLISKEISNGELITVTRHVKYLVTRRHQIGSLLSQVAHLKESVVEKNMEIENLTCSMENTEAGNKQAEAIDKLTKERDEAMEQSTRSQENVTQLRADNRRLERELLETIQKKIKYSQQVEQWQLDMEEMVENQVRTMFLLEQQNRQRPLKVMTAVSPQTAAAAKAAAEAKAPEVKQPKTFSRIDSRRFSFFRRRAKD